MKGGPITCSRSARFLILCTVCVWVTMHTSVRTHARAFFRDGRLAPPRFVHVFFLFRSIGSTGVG